MSTVRRREESRTYQTVRVVWRGEGHITYHCEDSRSYRGGANVDIDLKVPRPTCVMETKFLPNQRGFVAHSHLDHPRTLSLHRR